MSKTRPIALLALALLACSQNSNIGSSFLAPTSMVLFRGVIRKAPA